MSGLPASRCPVCVRSWVPVRAWCATCGGPVEEGEVAAEGRLLSWTVVRSAPEGFEPGYVVGLVDLGPTRVLAAGPRDAAELAVGVPVRVAVDPDGRLTFARTRSG